MNILITGASGAIGSAIASTLLNHNLILSYNNNLPLIKGETVLCVKCDMRNPDEIENMFNLAEKRFGEVDILINNCGISDFSMFQDIDLASWNNILNVNLNSYFLCTKRAVSAMIRKKSGHIINISSVWGETGASMEVHYSTSKGAIISFTKALSRELSPSGILVNCISPGLIESPMNASLSDEDLEEFTKSIGLARAGTPLEVAKLVKFFCEENTYITGQNIVIDGGLV